MFCLRIDEEKPAIHKTTIFNMLYSVLQSLQFFGNPAL